MRPPTLSLAMQIALFVSSSDAVQPGWLLKFLKGISLAQIRGMQRNLAKVCDSIKVYIISDFFYFFLFDCTSAWYLDFHSSFANWNNQT